MPAPDSMPRRIHEELFAPENLRHDPPGAYPQDVMWVFFAPATSRADRQATLEAARAQIVGGNGAHWYVLRLTDPCDAPLLDDLIRQVSGRPGVVQASRDLTLSIGTPGAISSR